MLKFTVFLFLIFLIKNVYSSDASEQEAASVKWYKGTYEYGLIDSEYLRGREDWIITSHGDGSRTLQSFVDLWELGHQTNVILRTDKTLRPLDAYVNFWRFGKYGGAARFWIKNDISMSKSLINSEVVGPSGRATHLIEVPHRFSLRLHPVITEGWQVWHYDHSGPNQQSGLIYNVVTVNDMGVRGIGILQDNVVEFLGSEKIKVQAGEFETNHYTFYDGKYDIWLWGSEKILIRYIVKSNGREYRLINLEQGP